MYLYAYAGYVLCVYIYVKFNSAFLFVFPWSTMQCCHYCVNGRYIVVITRGLITKICVYVCGVNRCIKRIFNENGICNGQLRNVLFILERHYGIYERLPGIV